MNSVFYRRECQSCKSKYHQLSARQDFTFFFTIFLLPSGSKTRFDLEACALQSHQFHNTFCEISVKIPLTRAPQDRTSQDVPFLIPAVREYIFGKFWDARGRGRRGRGRRGRGHPAEA